MAISLISLQGSGGRLGFVQGAAYFDLGSSSSCVHVVRGALLLPSN